MSNAARPLHCSAQMFVKWTQRLTITLLLLAGPIRFYGQCPPPGFRQFTADDGLPSSEVYEVLQDRQGYLWFSTDNGVSRFNGFEFKNFGAVDGLYEPVVFNLREDHRGRIWMQSMSGNLYFADKDDKILPYKGNDWVSNNKKKQTMGTGFFIDSLEQVFLSIDWLGLLKFAKNSQVPSYVVPGQHANAIYLGQQVPLLISNQFPDSSCYEEHRKMVHSLVPTGKSSLELISSKKSLNYFLSNDYKHEFLNAYRLSEGSLMVSRSNYLYFFEDEKLIHEHYFPYHVISFLQDNSGLLYLGLNYRNGVRIYRSVRDIATGNYTTLLDGYSITHILKDRDGGMWFTTNEAGVFYLPNPHVKIYNEQTGLPFRSVSAIAMGGVDTLYLGFDGGGIVSFKISTNNIAHLPSLVKKVDDLYFDELNKTLWAAGFPNLQFFRNGNWHIVLDSVRTNIQKNRYSFAGRHLHKIAGEQQLWASSHSGFVRVDLASFGVPSNKTDRSMLKLNYQAIRTHDILTSLDGRVFVSNTNGLFELKGDALQRPPTLHPAFLGRIEAMESLPDSTLVLGTKGYGLLFWKNGKVSSLTEQDGLTANMVENLCVDTAGQIWAGTLNGLNQIIWSWNGVRSIRNITIAHGLPSNEVTDVLSCGDQLWVSTVGGLAFFSDKLPQSGIPPKPIIEAVWVNEVQRSLPTTNQLILGSNDRNLRIKIISLQYANAPRILYRYRLHPDQPWAMLNGRNLNLAALANGDYHLEVQARNADLKWSTSTHLFFKVPPLWWQSAWFISLAIIGTLFTSVIAIHFRTNRVRQHKELQKQVVELEYSALQAQMNPHFIFNCLNSIQNFILLNEKNVAIEYLNSFARLVRGMLNASVSGSITLEEEAKLLKNYLLLEQLRFNHRFTYEVRLAPNLDLQIIKIPPLLIQPYVENAVLHGIANRESGGRVEVLFDEISEFLIVRVRDNGKGTLMTDAGQAPRFHKSVGMSITGRRLQLLCGQQGMQAVESNYAELNNGKPTGTQVTIRIKINKRKSFSHRSHTSHIK